MIGEIKHSELEKIITLLIHQNSVKPLNKDSLKDQQVRVKLIEFHKSEIKLITYHKDQVNKLQNNQDKLILLSKNIEITNQNHQNTLKKVMKDKGQDFLHI